MPFSRAHMRTQPFRIVFSVQCIFFNRSQMYESKVESGIPDVENLFKRGIFVSAPWRDSSLPLSLTVEQLFHSSGIMRPTWGFREFGIIGHYHGRFTL